MKELQDVVRAYESLPPGGEAVLATVMRVAGSTYRRPGARMLMSDTEVLAGAVSGGCLERDVLRKAWWRTESGAALVIYDARSGDDDGVGWGFGLGCDGAVEVLLERVGPGRGACPVAFAARNLRARRACVLATCVRSAREGEVGGRVLLDETGLHVSTLKATIAALVGEGAVRSLTEGVSGEARVGPEGAEVVYEYLAPPIPLTVFGNGYDVVPLANAARGLGWFVTVVESRRGAASAGRIAGAERVVVMPFDGPLGGLELGPRAAAVVMTHNYFDDLALLGTLVGAGLGYLGVLGPRRRTERLLRELSAAPGQSRSRLFFPVGLDLGAESPEAIALSVVAEAHAVLAGRGAGFLRDRPGPLHARTPTTAGDEGLV